MARWFRRVADIPGVSYSCNHHIDRTHLVGSDFVPEVATIGFVGKPRETLEWPSENGYGSVTSPAGSRRALIAGDIRDIPASDILRNLYECLELPGEPADYHFMLQACAEALLKRSRVENILSSDMEWLCKLDISLVQADRDAVIPLWDPEQRPTPILCFDILIGLYERQGRLKEALEVVEIASTFDQCRSVVRRLREQIALGKGGRRQEIETIRKTLSRYLNGAIPDIDANSGQITDWGFRSDDDRGAFAGGPARWYDWWNDSHQERFNRLWGPEGERVADDLADLYGPGWPWLIGEALATSAPVIYERLVGFSDSVNRHGTDRLPVSHLEAIAIWGSFQIVRKRRTWQEPSAAVCPVCGKDFWDGNVTPWALKAFGPARYCMECCEQSRNGDPWTRWSEGKVIQAIQELRDAFGAIPQQRFAYMPIPYDGAPEQRDRRMRALVAMPNVEVVKSVLGQKDWLGVLRTAGLVGETWRPSRGTWCHAKDGHRCRSLLEKSIDDWLSRNNIDHACEPRWPRHPKFNPSGAKRADWLLPDGTYVECAGMMEDPEYAAKIAVKRQLAEELQIPLMVIGPTDMHRLDSVFAARIRSQRE